MAPHDGKMFARSGDGSAAELGPTMTDQERRALDDALAAGIAEMERGDVVDMDEVLANA